MSPQKSCRSVSVPGHELKRGGVSYHTGMLPARLEAMSDDGEAGSTLGSCHN